jgi:uncharacterized protein YndB with AHSA1/START domain
MTFAPHTLDPELDLEIDREIDVAPELVWRAWTEPELIKQWFTPRPWTTPVVEVDLRPGGKFRTVMRSPEGDENDNTGCFLEIVPNERLVWTGALGPDFRPQTGPLVFTAIIELQPNGSGGTQYRIVVMHPDGAMRKEHAEMGFLDGWGAALDQLVELMRGV